MQRPGSVGALTELLRGGRYLADRGLATAVYGASEGLSIIVLEAHSFGGQAGASARIENFFGFPTGISGQALMARAFTQAQKFGAQFSLSTEVNRLDPT